MRFLCTTKILCDSDGFEHVLIVEKEIVPALKLWEARRVINSEEENDTSISKSTWTAGEQQL